MYRQGLKWSVLILISSCLAFSLVFLSVEAARKAAAPPTLLSPTEGRINQTRYPADRDCDWVSYYCNDYYYWLAPDGYWGEMYAMRFSPADCCTLMSVELMLYDDYPEFSNASGEGINVQIWEDDGTGLPGALLHAETIPGEALVFYPQPLTFALTGGGLVICNDFHVGYSIVNEATDNIAIVSDDGTCGTIRSSAYIAGIWENILDHFAMDVNFLISSQICIDFADDSLCCEILPDSTCIIDTCETLTPVEQWHWPVDCPGVTLPLYDEVIMTPVVADLEGVGSDPEVFFISFKKHTGVQYPYSHYYYGGVLRVVDGATGCEVFSFPETEPADSAELWDMFFGSSQIAVGDVIKNDNGLLEIIATRRGDYIPTGANNTRTLAGQGLYCIDILDKGGDGTYDVDPNPAFSDVWIAWQSDNPYDSINSSGISIADIDKDGNAEVIVGNVVLNGQTGALWAHGYWHENRADADPLAGISPVVSTSFAADIVPGGDLEVVNGSVVYYSDGTAMWNLRTLLNGGSAAVANFDADPECEVVLSWSKDNIARVSLIEPDLMMPGSPTVAWTRMLENPNNATMSTRVGPLCIGECNLTVPNTREITVATDRAYFVLDAMGNITQAWETKDWSSGVTGSTMFDFENDGITELVYNDEDTLWIFRYGEPLPVGKIANTDYTVIENPVVADVDADGRAEIVVCSNDIQTSADGDAGIRVFGSAEDCWVNTRRIWNQHSYSITNVNDDGSIPDLRYENWQYPWPVLNDFRKQMMLGEDIRFLPDLCVHMLRPTWGRDCDGAGSPVYTATVVNNGFAAVAPGVEVAFYHANGVFPPHPGDCDVDVLIGTAFTTTTIMPGQTEDVTFVDLESFWPRKTYIHVCVDDDGYGNGSLQECNEDNNCCCHWLWTECGGIIMGTKFEDLNLNGLFDWASGELWLAGWTISVYSYHQGTGETEFITSAITDAKGFYKITSLRALPYPYIYRVYESPPTGPDTWLQTTPLGGFYEIPAQLDTLTGLDFGNIKYSSINCVSEPNVPLKVVSFCQNEQVRPASFTITRDNPCFGPGGCDNLNWYIVAVPSNEPPMNCSSTQLKFAPSSGTLDLTNYTQPVTVNFDVDCSSTTPSLVPGGCAGFKVILRNNLTEELCCFYGKATMSNKWCIVDFPVPFDPNTGIVVSNTGYTRASFSYRFTPLLTGDGVPDPYVSLNGLPAGESFEDTVEIAAGDTATITVAHSFTEARPGEIHQLLLEFDTDEDGDLDPALTVPLIYWLCGDANADGLSNITDAVYLIQYIFNGGPAPQPLIAGDANCDGLVNITDAVYLIQYIFSGGPSPCEDCP